MSRACTVIGAGIAGLLAAETLQGKGWQVVVLDKGRGVGGRMATRRVGAAVFDHGAQFFTVRDERFAALVETWVEAGVAVEWARGFANAEGQRNNDRYPRYRGVQGMTSVPKALAAGLDVRLQTRVTVVRLEAGLWQVESEDGQRFTSEALLMTPPVPQSLALLDAGHVALPYPARAALAGIAYHSCIAVMALLDGPSGLPAPGAVQVNGEPISWLGDNFQKGISPVHAVTIHAGPQFSREHWDAKPQDAGRLLLEAAAPWLGAGVTQFEVQRWRYSQPLQPYPEACLFLAEPAPLVFAGDAFAGPRVEGAALSGLAAAERLSAGA